MYACESSDLKMVESLLTKNASVAFCNQVCKNTLGVRTLGVVDKIIPAGISVSGPPPISVVDNVEFQQLNFCTCTSPALKMGKEPGHTCKNSHVCHVSSLRLE